MKAGEGPGQELQAFAFLLFVRFALTTFRPIGEVFLEASLLAFFGAAAAFAFGVFLPVFFFVVFLVMVRSP